VNNEDFMTGEELGEKLLQAVREMQAGLGRVVHSPIAEARAKTGLSETQFAGLFEVSVDTLQQWEQGQAHPAGAAKTLLKIAEQHPEVLRELAA
jgi:putative transcriptional regulator